MKFANGLSAFSLCWLITQHERQETQGCRPALFAMNDEYMKEQNPTLIYRVYTCMMQNILSLGNSFEEYRLSGSIDQVNTRPQPAWVVQLLQQHLKYNTHHIIVASHHVSFQPWKTKFRWTWINCVYQDTGCKTLLQENLPNRCRGFKQQYIWQYIYIYMHLHTVRL